jgi:hypothetical protein
MKNYEVEIEIELRWEGHAASKEEAEELAYDWVSENIPLSGDYFVNATGVEEN